MSIQKRRCSKDGARLARFTHAIIGSVPDFIYKQSVASTSKIEEEYTEFTATIQSLVRNVIVLPPNEIKEIYLENSVIICHGTAILTKPRERYSENFLKILEEQQLRVVILDDPDAKLDGGDVLFTGVEFYVGISYNTNEIGANFIADVFPEYCVVPIKISGSWNLKYYVTMAGPDLLCLSKHPESMYVLQQIRKITTYPYVPLLLSEQTASNVLYVNGTLIHRSIETEIPCSKEALETLDIPRVGIEFAELGKLATGFSSFCLLFRHPKFLYNV